MGHMRKNSYDEGEVADVFALAITKTRRNS